MNSRPSGPAEHAGIEAGDILFSWEGHQIYGDDPHKPFPSYGSPNNDLREALESHSKSRGWSTFNMDFDLRDHRTGEVIRLSPWFGMAAGGGPDKAEVVKRLRNGDGCGRSPDAGWRLVSSYLSKTWGMTPSSEITAWYTRHSSLSVLNNCMSKWRAASHLLST